GNFSIASLPMLRIPFVDARPLCGGFGFRVSPVADLHDLNPARCQSSHLLDRPGPAVVDTWIEVHGQTAETPDHAHLIGSHQDQPGQYPEQGYRRNTPIADRAAVVRELV